MDDASHRLVAGFLVAARKEYTMLFRKRMLYPPETAEMTIGQAGEDVAWIEKQFGRELSVRDAQNIWSEYMKVQYALVLNVIARKRPDIVADFAYFKKNAARGCLKSASGVDILSKEVNRASWFVDVREYQELALDKIAPVLCTEIVALWPYELSQREQNALRHYVTTRVSFVQAQLMKFRFDVHTTRAEIKATAATNKREDS